MSFQAFAWAVTVHPGSAAEKLVLLGLADRHNTEHDAAYPSTAWLVEFSGLDRKTVVAALDRLEAAGLISDTGKRVGQTKQVKVYSLALESLPKTEASQKRNSSVFPMKGSQKRDTDTVKDTSTSRAKALSGPRAKKTTFEQSFDESSKHSFRILCVQWAVTNLRWTAGDAGSEYERFVDRALAASAAYSDWLAAWRNWCRSPYCTTKPAGSKDSDDWTERMGLGRRRSSNG
jgi:hypothetical protein